MDIAAEFIKVSIMFRFIS